MKQLKLGDEEFDVISGLWTGRERRNGRGGERRLETLFIVRMSHVFRDERPKEGRRPPRAGCAPRRCCACPGLEGGEVVLPPFASSKNIGTDHQI